MSLTTIYVIYIIILEQERVNPVKKQCEQFWRGTIALFNTLINVKIEYIALHSI
jgi:hypothetical protein